MPRSFRKPLFVRGAEPDPKEAPRHAPELVIAAEDGDRLLRRNLFDGETLTASSASKLDPPGSTCILDPVAVAVGGHERASGRTTALSARRWGLRR
jgi:hypothetical protein